MAILNVWPKITTQEKPSSQNWALRGCYRNCVPEVFGSRGRDHGPKHRIKAVLSMIDQISIISPNRTDENAGNLTSWRWEWFPKCQIQRRLS